MREHLCVERPRLPHVLEVRGDVQRDLHRVVRGVGARDQVVLWWLSASDVHGRVWGRADVGEGREQLFQLVELVPVALPTQVVFQRDRERVQERDGVLLRVGVTGPHGGARFLLRHMQPDGAGDVAREGRDLVPFGAALPPPRVGGGHAERDGERDDEAARGSMSRFGHTSETRTLTQTPETRSDCAASIYRPRPTTDSRSEQRPCPTPESTAVSERASERAREPDHEPA